MEHDEYLHLRMENLPYQNQTSRLSNMLEEPKPSEIDKYKSRNGPRYRMNLLC